MSKRLVTIRDGGIEVGVIPDLGGMVASLHVIGMPNILKADRAQWNQPPVIHRTFDPNSHWKPNNGQIVWVGPQSEWWAHQNKSPKRRRAKSKWPPDPYLDHGNFEVVERGDTELVLQGPKSEFTGVQLTKTIKVEDGIVYFDVSAKNIRRTPVSWDLWLNLRVDGYARVYVPVTNDQKVRVEGKETATRDMSIFDYDEGYCFIDARVPLPEKNERFAKAYINAKRGAMAAFFHTQALIIRFKKHHPDLIHPEHSVVELYNYTNNERNDALTEMEYHSPYVTLQPGETMETSQQWEVYPFKSRWDHHRCCVEFMREMNV
jgi:hypothetical protein